MSNTHDEYLHLSETQYMNALRLDASAWDRSPGLGAMANSLVTVGYHVRDFDTGGIIYTDYSYCTCALNYAIESLWA